MIKKYGVVSNLLYKAVAKSIFQSIESKEFEIFKMLNSFLLDRLNANFKVNDKDAFSSFADLFVLYYENSVKGYRNSISNLEIHAECSRYAGECIKQTILQITFDDTNTDIKRKNKSNEYSKILLSKLGDLIYTSIKYKDFTRLAFFLSQLEQISNWYYPDIYEEIEIAHLKNKQLNLSEEQSLKTREESYNAYSYISKIVRRTFKVVLFWVYYLYEEDVLNEDDLRKIETVITQYNQYIDSEQLNDIYYLRSTSFGQDEYWNRWDYKERQEMKLYSPPSVLHWITFGSLIYLLKNNAAISYDINDTNPKHIESFDYLLSTMSKLLNHLEYNGYDKWHSFFDTTSKELFKKRIDSFRSQINFLQQKNITKKERTIAQLPIDEDLVNSAKDVIIKEWKKNNLVRELFKNFDNIENNIQKKGLKLLGEKDKIKEGWKISFIKHNEYHIPIGNFESYGRELSKLEERIFIQMIANENKIEVQNWLTGIEDSIINLNKNGYNPSIILLGYKLFHSSFFNLKSQDFIYNSNMNVEFPFSSYGGFYKNIPIIPMWNDFFNNNVIVADFKESFLLEQYYENNLPIILNIELLSDEEAEDIVNSNKDYWKHGLSDEEAIIRVKNSIKFNLHTYMNIKIKNHDAFSILWK